MTMSRLPLVPWQLPVPERPGLAFANHGLNTLTYGILPRNEFGLPLCARPDGTLVRDVPVSWGTPTGVNVEMVCPPGSRLLGSLHAHPKGVPYPSRTDLEAYAASGSILNCIVADGPGHEKHTLNCFWTNNPSR